MLGLICHFYHPVIHNYMIPLRFSVVSSNFLLSAGCCHLPICHFPHYLWVVWIVLCTAQLPEKLCVNLYCKKLTSLQLWFRIFSYFFPKTLCYKSVRQLPSSCNDNLVSLGTFVKVTYKSLLEIQAVCIIMINLIQKMLWQNLNRFWFLTSFSENCVESFPGCHLSMHIGLSLAGFYQLVQYRNQCCSSTVLSIILCNLVPFK